jgi:hypothetical protein
MSKQQSFKSTFACQQRNSPEEEQLVLIKLVVGMQMHVPAPAKLPAIRYFYVSDKKEI